MRLALLLVLLQLSGNVAVSLPSDTCSQVPVVAHAQLSEDTKQAEYREGNIIHFPCDTGYISGPTIRYVCTTKGWERMNQAKCYLKPCQLPDETPNGYYQIIAGEDLVFGTTIKYFCNDGYQMVSKVDTRSCLLDKWTNHVPVCESLSCDPPPNDSEVTVEGLPDNEMPILPDRFLTFSCDVPGKYLNGSKVLICGKDGQWSDLIPTCEDITCKVGKMHPRITAHGLPSGNKTVKTGHELNFECDDGFTLTSSETIRCLETGEWSAPLPTCSEKCVVTGVANTVSVNRAAGTQLPQGEKLKFSCRVQGHVIRGKSEVECLANGQWSHPFPTCGVPLNCNQPPPLDNGDTKESTRFNYRHNERVEYTCQNLYTMQGGAFKTCNNGEWIGEMRCLRACTVDSTVIDQRNIAFKYGRQTKLYAPHNDVIQFRCTRGRQVGPHGMRQRCDDGQMNLPMCQ